MDDREAWHRAHVANLVAKEVAQMERQTTRQERLQALVSDIDVRPPRGLVVVRELKAELRAIEREVVKKARDDGWAWAEVARVLGVSRQVIHRKYVSGTPKAKKPAAAKANKASR
ncbi:MAG: hypothetical protein QOG03_2573 [Actinomycetota bacterium]|jgi:hypothetical protein|nr:hypothetical protein [Actinomycetota bacterium]